MQTSGDVVDLDLGQPEGREAGFLHPAIVITAQRILDAEPSVVHVVPLTSTIRTFHSEIVIEPDETNGLSGTSAAQCQHLRAVSPQRIVVDPRQRRAAESFADSRNARRHPRHRVTVSRNRTHRRPLDGPHPHLSERPIARSRADTSGLVAVKGSVICVGRAA